MLIGRRGHWDAETPLGLCLSFNNAHNAANVPNVHLSDGNLPVGHQSTTEHGGIRVIVTARLPSPLVDA